MATNILKSAHTIQEIISQSNKNKKAIISRSFIIHYRKNDLTHPRFCFAVSKKNRTAPEKNLIKRQLREMTKDFNSICYDFIVIPRIQFTKNKFDMNKNELTKTLNKVKGVSHGNRS